MGRGKTGRKVSVNNAKRGEDQRKNARGMGAEARGSKGTWRPKKGGSEAGTTYLRPIRIARAKSSSGLRLKYFIISCAQTH